MSSARKALLWSLVERYVGLAVNLASSMLIARLLTPGEIGIFSLCAATMAVAATLRDFGVSEYIVQERELSRERLRGAYGAAILTAWTIGLAVFLLRRNVADYYGQPTIADLIAILSINFIILPFATPASALMTRSLAFRSLFLAQATSTVTQALVGILLALSGAGPFALAWGVVAGTAAQVLALTILRPRDSLLTPSFAHASHALRYGLYAVSGRVLDTVSGNAHEFIIAKQFGFAAVGLFSRAKGTVDLFSTYVTSALLRVATPALAEAHRANSSILDAFSRGTAVFCAVAVPFFSFVALAAPEVIRTLFGSQWDAAAPIASLLAIAMFPGLLCTLNGSALAAMGLVKIRLKISAASFPFHVGTLLLTAIISLETVALSWMATHLLLLMLLTHHLKKALNATARDLYGSALPGFLLGLCLAPIQWAILFACRSASLPAALSAGLTLALSAALWLIAVRRLRHPINELLDKVQLIRKWVPSRLL